MNCGKDKIFNPDTSRCVKITGKVGKDIIKKYGNNPIIKCKDTFYFEDNYGCKKGKKVPEIKKQEIQQHFDPKPIPKHFGPRPMPSHFKKLPEILKNKDFIDL